MQNTSDSDTRHNSDGTIWLQWGHQNREIRKKTGEAKMTTRTNKKQTNIEGKFFGMIVLAWVILAIVFNIAHSFLPQAKAPAAKTAVTGTVQVASLR
jgi:hypothetical protein